MNQFTEEKNCCFYDDMTNSSYFKTWVQEQQSDSATFYSNENVYQSELVLLC